jgi:serine/threonine protein kinase
MEDYKVIRAIGKGSFGKVYLVRHSGEGRQYVMKVIKLKGIPPKER